MSTASLLIVEGVGRGTRFQIGRQRVGIGRSSENTVRIEDSEASRFHAAIQWQDAGFTLTDLGSANGTLLNGVRVETAVIVAGDQLQVASTLFAFQVHGATPPRGRVPVDLVAGNDDRSSIVSETTDVMSTTRSGALEGGAADLLAGDLSAGIAEDWSVNEVEALASLGALYRISEQVADPAATLDTILVTILDVALEVVSADRGCVLMASAETGVPEPRVYRARNGNGGGELDEVPVMPVPRSIVDLVMTGGRGVRTSDAQRDDRFSGGGSILQAGVREAVCAPLVGRQAVLGAIYLDTTTRVDEVVVEGEVNERLSEESLRLLVAIGRQAALAIDGQRNQQALVQAERLAAVGQTIATLSHHIKNILQGVRGGSYLINLGLKDHDEQLIQRGWGIVDRNQGRIYDLVMDMLTYSTDRTPAWNGPMSVRRSVMFVNCCSRGLTRRVWSWSECCRRGPPKPTTTPRGFTERCSMWSPTRLMRLKVVLTRWSLSEWVSICQSGQCSSISTTTGQGFPRTSCRDFSVCSLRPREPAGPGWGSRSVERSLVSTGGKFRSRIGPEPVADFG